MSEGESIEAAKVPRSVLEAAVASSEAARQKAESNAERLMEENALLLGEKHESVKLAHSLAALWVRDLKARCQKAESERDAKDAAQDE